MGFCVKKIRSGSQSIHNQLFILENTNKIIKFGNLFAVSIAGEATYIKKELNKERG